MTECEVATVTIEMGGETAQLKVPAFTRPWPELTELVNQYLSIYTTASTMDGSEGSLADFAMYLLTQASNDPRNQT